MIAVIGSALVAVAGLYLLMSPDAGDFAAFGWVFVGLGVLGTVLNLVLRARNRWSPSRHERRR